MKILFAKNERALAMTVVKIHESYSDARSKIRV